MYERKTDIERERERERERKIERERETLIVIDKYEKRERQTIGRSDRQKNIFQIIEAINKQIWPDRPKRFFFKFVQKP